MENASQDEPEWVRYFTTEVFDEAIRSYRFVLSVAVAPILVLSLGNVLLSTDAISSHVKFALFGLFLSMVASAIAIEILSAAKRAFLMYEKSDDISVFDAVGLFPNSRFFKLLPLLSGFALCAGYLQLIIEVIVA